MTAAINRSLIQTLPDMAERFAVFKTRDGDRVALYINDDDECRKASEAEVVSAILNYCQTTLCHIPEYLFTEREARECAKFWLYSTSPIPEPAPFKWRSEPGVTFRRIPLELSNGVAPTWDILLSRMTNVDAFIDWIGSLFVPESDRQQYLWIYGEGNDGKGSINRVLSKIFGSAYFACQPPKPDRTDFWGYYALVGTRLVVFPDCNASGFVKGGYFKSLTGDDPVSVEIKGGAAFTHRPTAKFMFHSNVMPHITSQKSDTRRLIYCSFDTDGMRVDCSADEFEDRLWAEAGIFIHDCIAWYRKRYPKHGPIKNDATGEAEIAKLASANEEDFELACDSIFEIGDGFELPRIVMQDKLRVHFVDKVRRSDFISWLRRTHGVAVIPSGTKASRTRVYGRIRLRP